jgi:hypothetical protein
MRTRNPARPTIGARAVAATVLAALMAGACGSTSAASARPATNHQSVPECTSLTIAYGGKTSGLGHFGLVVDFKNTSAMACTLEGYPKATPVDANGEANQVARDSSCGYLVATKCGTAPLPVRLGAGQTASALVEGTALSTRKTCPVAPAFRVVAPGLDRSVVIDLPARAWSIMASGAGMPACAPIEIHAVVAGDAG